MGGTGLAQWVSVGRLDDLRPNRCVVVDVDDVRLLLVRTSEAVYALQGTCTHADSVLGPGRLVDDLIECPMHGACFDPTDGAVVVGPATEPLATYAVSIDDEGTIRVDLDLGPWDRGGRDADRGEDT